MITSIKIEKNKRVDLNLLVFFDAIYQTGSVKLAASLLNCSSPNVSQELQKLRNIIGDPLFIRNGQRLSATTVAIRLHEKIKSNLYELQYSMEYFSEQMKRKLVIDCMPFFSIKIIPLLTSFFDMKGIACEIVNLSHQSMDTEYAEQLSLKKVDMIFGIDTDLGLSKEHLKIGEDTGILVCRNDHPRLKESYLYGIDSPENIAKVYSDYDAVKRVRNLNSDFFEKSQCTLQAQSFLAICAHLAVSDSIAIIPESFFEKFKGVFNLKSLKTNLTVPRLNVSMYFNKSSGDRELYFELHQYLKENYNLVLF